MLAKRSFYNLTFGMVGQLITISLGLLIPRIFLVHYGSEVYGFISSIGQIIVYMSLLEAGVGAATLQALYKHVAKVDQQNINSILAATSNFYKKTGMYYLISVILLSIIYPFIVDSTLDKTTIIIVVLFTGLGGALNYYFQGTYTIFLIAEGKGYINTSITTIINILVSSIKIILILKGFNIIIIQGSYFFMSIIQIFIYKVYINKNYKWIDLKVNPNFESIAQKNSVIVHQISGMIFRNTDVLVLTIFTNLKIVSVYVLYNLLFSVIDNIINTVNNSIIFALGRTFHQSRDIFIKLYDAYEVYFMALVFSLFTIAYIFILPFMKIYTSGIEDINYIDFWLPILFVLLKLLSNARASSNSLIEIAGHFSKTKYRSIIESLINLVSSIIFVQFFGIYGVLLGTIMALLYRSVDIIIYANKRILKRSSWITIKRWIINFGIILVIVFTTDHININLTSYISVVSWAAMFTVIILLIFFTVSSLFEKEIFVYTFKYLVRLKKGKIKRS
ncbi:sugar isomerase [Bacillus sp. UNC41MFS5]|uniref:sugar isomerase n=1 Tax=Bacillus sp. UNC41MFS5 TaxID=1449046 RepID=UPI00047E823C|nr:sugar isomerase [Bacillus sp. UNC41MFS5]